MNYRRKEKTEDALPLPIGAKQEKFKPKVQFKTNMTINIDSVLESVKKIQWKLIVYFVILWIMVVHFFERTVPKNAFKRCEWNNWEGWNEKSKSAVPHRVALIADPQIVDEHTYEDRPLIVTYFIKKISDNYLYRNHIYLNHYLDPDSMIFLGDLFDGGREWDDSIWMKEFKRFNKIFPKKVNRNCIQSLPGNHDIGFQKVDYEVSKRFNAFFGEPNDFYELGNHSIVLLDSISLSYANPKIQREPMEFLNTLNDKLNPQFPRILLTHVPLYRFNDKQLCGPLRESHKKFPVRKGHQYQTVIDYEISQQVLKTVRPEIVFSGDDHDYCDIQHSYYENGKESLSREITVKTASMTNGIKYPAMQLLSLNNPYDPKPKKKTVDEDDLDHEERVKHTFSTHMCYLPSPYAALNSYIFTLILSIGFLFIYFVCPRTLLTLIKFKNSILQKDTVLPLFDLGKWKPVKSNDQILFLEAERNINGFLSHTTVLILFIYLVFSIYYRFI